MSSPWQDEKIKPMIRVGGRRLIDFALDALEGTDAERAVLSYPSPEYDELDRRVEERGATVLKQRAKRIRQPQFLELLVLPYVLGVQYHLSEDRDYLRSFDSVLTMPCDVVLEGVDLGRMVNFHYDHLGSPEERQVTVLSKLERGGGRTDLFRMEGDRIAGMKRGGSVLFDGYEPSTQAGVYVFSRGMLESIWMAFFGFKYNRILRHVTAGTWADYGNPDNLRRLRHEPQEYVS
ncbi:MAG: hypothetical protein HYW25_05820 [Candidatus Aenigmarchaeota archaeon]|nr:hypothetical protein [Candidatus Aenigmarchaeota archaeon]